MALLVMRLHISLWAQSESGPADFHHQETAKSTKQRKLYERIEISRMTMMEMAGCGDADRHGERNRQATNVVLMAHQSEMISFYFLSRLLLPSNQIHHFLTISMMRCMYGVPRGVYTFPRTRSEKPLYRVRRSGPENVKKLDDYVFEQ